MINPNELDQLKNIDVREIAQRLPISLSGKGGELAGPCPKCGGEDRFHVTAQSFWCRTGPDHCGTKGDGIALVRLCNPQMSFADACEWLRNMGNLPMLASGAARPTATATEDWRGEAWQTEANAYAAKTAKLIFSAPLGLDYLHGRGLTDDTIAAFGLGYSGKAFYNSQHPSSLAIVIPWRDGEMLSCVRWRFINPPGCERYRYAKFPPDRTGSAGQAILFRSPKRRSNTLVIVEGEFNAMSVYQASTFDPVSSGSQNFGSATMAALAELAPQYERVLIWADESTTAQSIQAVLNHPAATLFQSPLIDGAKLDANALLQAGLLGELLERLVEPVERVEPFEPIEAIEHIEFIESVERVEPILGCQGSTRSTEWLRPVTNVALWQRELESGARSSYPPKQAAAQLLSSWLQGVDIDRLRIAAALHELGGPIAFCVNWDDPSLNLVGV